MNDSVKRYIAESGKSIYKISKETGIPYTTLSELMHDKSHVNQIASETVCKLCLYFCCSYSDLLDDFPFLNNSSGRYKGVRYLWKQTSRGIELHIDDKKTDVILATLRRMVPSKYSYYQHEIPELLIDTYLEDKMGWEALP